MPYKYSFLPKAYTDLAKAREWYDDRSYKAGDELLDETKLYIKRIISNPHQYKKINPFIRRCLMKIFPYTIFYRVEEDTVFILRIRHKKQKPLKRYK